MEEGVVVEWLVAEGDSVSEGDPVVVFETDKMTSEIAANQDGRLLKRVVDEGETIPVGTVLGYLGTDADEVPDSSGRAKDEGRSPESEPEESGGESLVRGSPKTRRIARENGVSIDEIGHSLNVSLVRPHHIEEYLDQRDRGDDRRDDRGSGGEILASPLARRTVDEEGVALEAVAEFAESDRLRVTDVRAYLESGDAGAVTRAAETGDDSGAEVSAETRSPVASSDAAPKEAPAVADRLPIEGVRGAMFDRMSAVATEYASTTTVARVDVTRLLELNETLTGAWEEVHDVKPSLTAFVVRAVATKLPAYPILNAEVVNGESVDLYDDVNVGIAVNADAGLLVPTVYHADERSVRETSAEIRRLATAAREGDLEYDDMQNGTFTVSNAGSLGAYMNTPQINPPQTAILGMCTVFDHPDIDGGDLVARKMMHLCLTYDHRVVEGATAVEFLQSVKGLLEEPESLLS